MFINPLIFCARYGALLALLLLVLGAFGPVRAQGNWQYCAAQDEICRFDGQATVRYTAQGKFVTMRAINGLPCGLETFGRDLVYGQLKQCFVRGVR